MEAMAAICVQMTEVLRPLPKQVCKNSRKSFTLIFSGERLQGAHHSSMDNCRLADFLPASKVLRTEPEYPKAAMLKPPCSHVKSVEQRVEGAVELLKGPRDRSSSLKGNSCEGITSSSIRSETKVSVATESN